VKFLFTGPLILAFLFVINLMTSPGHWWVQWAALGIGIAWALSRSGRVTVPELLPLMVDDDARRWVAYILGTQNKDAFLAQIEELRRRDPQVYFAVTVLWKILASWVYDLEEY
jgi:hypothetical protein